MNNIFDRLQISPEAFTDLVDANPSLRGMVLGYVAEYQFHQKFLAEKYVTSVVKDDDHDRDKKGDRRIVYKGETFTIEVKSLQTKTCKKTNDGWVGKAQVDGSDRRNVVFSDGSSVQTTLLTKGGFDILAVNCFSFNNEWDFVFIKNSDLPTSRYKKYTPPQQEQLIASLVQITYPLQAPFRNEPYSLMDEIIEERRSLTRESRNNF